MNRRPAFHEDFSRDDHVEGSSDRNFGLTFAVVFLLIATWSWWVGGHHWMWWLAGSAAFAAVALLRASLLAPLNRQWTRLGLLLFKIVNPVMMGVLFVTTILPIGLFMRLLGKDLLRLSLDGKATSYWIKRDPPGPPPAGMKNQF